MPSARIAAVALGAAMIALPAYAQTSTSPSQPSTSAQPSGAASGQFMTKQGSDEWRAYKMVGLNVYGPSNEKIGDIQDILIDHSGAAKAVVIGVGGFLGIGSKNVAVPFNELEWKMEPMRTASGGTGSTSSTTGASGSASSTSSAAKEYPDHAVLKMTKDQLQNAPSFAYAAETRGSSK